MKKIILIFFLIFFVFSCAKQENIEIKKNFLKTKKVLEKNKDENEKKSENFGISKIVQLDKKINETSGILVINNEIWTINDSGGKEEFYKIDSKSGKILETKKILNAKNIDWEAIAQNKDFIFIGDIGNNKGNRKIFQIYKISKKDFLKNKNLFAGKIEFSYKNFIENKKLEDKNLEKINFSKMDSEAMIYFNKNLYIFSKGWKDYKIRIYKINPNKTFQKIEKIDEKNLGTLISGAFNYKNKIYLVGYKDIFTSNPNIIILKDFKNDKFFSGKIIQKNIFSNFYSAQTEGIGVNDKKIFLTSEKEKYAKLNKQSLIILDKK